MPSCPRRSSRSQVLRSIDVGSWVWDFQRLWKHEVRSRCKFAQHTWSNFGFSYTQLQVFRFTFQTSTRRRQQVFRFTFQTSTRRRQQARTFPQPLQVQTSKHGAKWPWKRASSEAAGADARTIYRVASCPRCRQRNNCNSSRRRGRDLERWSLWEVGALGGNSKAVLNRRMIWTGLQAV